MVALCASDGTAVPPCSMVGKVEPAVSRPCRKGSTKSALSWELPCAGEPPRLGCLRKDVVWIKDPGYAVVA